MAKGPTDPRPPAMTVAEIRKRYREAHRRLWGEPKPEPEPVKPEPVKPEPPPKPKAPEPPPMPPSVKVEDMPVFPIRSRSLAELLVAVCAQHNVPVPAIVGYARGRRESSVRQEFFYRAVMETDASLAMIGRFCAGRDHSTVYHGAWNHAAKNGLTKPSQLNRGDYRQRNKDMTYE